MITVFLSIILSLVLYGCEISYLILREECVLRVFENRVLEADICTKDGRFNRGLEEIVH
jgi:hypothetical protein